MAQLRRDSGEFARRSVKLLGVAVQKKNRLKAYLTSHPMPFPMLADETREVTKTYGVYVAFNYESFRIARPATFLIDADGIVRFIHVGKNQFDRPTPERILSVIDAALPAALKRVGTEHAS
jgi:methyl-accepting chemotaxis protein